MRETPFRLLLDARTARKQGSAGIMRRQRQRLSEMVTHARTCSPFYRRLYQGLPARVTDPRLLPVTNKADLMAHFDDWPTDPAITLEETQTFAADPSLVGEKFLNRYTLATTSGTTGTRGLFLLDTTSLAVAQALTFRMLSSWLSPADLAGIIRGRGRIAMVIATGGHFASAAAAASLRKGPARRSVGVFPVQTPMPDLVALLNDFRPAILAPYASTGWLLAGEQEAGRLNIQPAAVILSAEGLPATEYARISAAFRGAKVRQGYAATECPFLSYSCPEGWLHVNSDWAILEPVDADHAPVPPGQPSHTVLLSNLANRVQPILRYDLGDSVTAKPDPCLCGDPTPAIQVEGRTAELLTFPRSDGLPVSVTPLTLATVLDSVQGLTRGQIVQTGLDSLSLRLQPAAGANPENVWEAACTEITRVLTSFGLGGVTITRDAGLPQLTPGGKHRTVVPLPP
ncbi:phenylacetate--CoA ligase family protein [Pseudarthrobacter sp. NIBRBAC000502770]|uniref:phenylacetate--CoA ligase family protein n=1 Tax=Pseudarthrobacter sp. NIBRBAC000502770 TaxID=2590785 RepID=UPI00114049B6|nr:phenylacetate--CoA ligase family protein [Pseudarthrobacter sp. NIBRBAC000502770]QDG87054.1 phenylacetate--CoA ligase family protein [Pseudarthrobacter sp. NIBRBAC000502770]